MCVLIKALSRLNCRLLILFLHSLLEAGIFKPIVSSQCVHSNVFFCRIKRQSLSNRKDLIVAIGKTKATNTQTEAEKDTRDAVDMRKLKSIHFYLFRCLSTIFMFAATFFMFRYRTLSHPIFWEKLSDHVKRCPLSSVFSFLSLLLLSFPFHSVQTTLNTQRKCRHSFLHLHCFVAVAISITSFFLSIPFNCWTLMVDIVYQ